MNGSQGLYCLSLTMYTISIEDNGIVFWESIHRFTWLVIWQFPRFWSSFSSWNSLLLKQLSTWKQLVNLCLQLYSSPVSSSCVQNKVGDLFQDPWWRPNSADNKICRWGTQCHNYLPGGHVQPPSHPEGTSMSGWCCSITSRRPHPCLAFPHPKIPPKHSQNFHHIWEVLQPRT